MSLPKALLQKESTFSADKSTNMFFPEAKMPTSPRVIYDVSVRLDGARQNGRARSLSVMK